MRRKNYSRRVIEPDPVYNSTLVAKFINLVMKDGKKNLASRIVYTTLKRLEKQYQKEGSKILEEALDKARPNVILKARRVGGSNFQVPTPVERDRGLIIAMRWLIKIARERKGKPIIEDLIEEINDIFEDRGNVLKKRDETHKMAESNRAFSHFK
ncbi:MAG: 30S ribosomal protein S7 [Candidatus Dojkabacteria bacterium]|nr:MAG: 30S ribosomal protein S7 [Candidatus Dojkabacteria bacterium]